MSLSEQNIKLILGLKIKHLRLEKNISPTELAERAQISISYLNEIEKGRKHPKPSKIAKIAEVLGTSYDWLVSTKLNRRLQPLGELLHSNILQEIPLEHFGIDISRLIDLFATAPTRLSAFISTLLEISRSYDLKVEQFYFSALRSYQEIQDNYFENIEDAANAFLEENFVKVKLELNSSNLAKVLNDNYHIKVNYDKLKDHPELKSLRSILLTGANQQLLVNPDLSEEQKRFTICRELGFQVLEHSVRPFTSSWVKINSFEEVVHNFNASYFAGALLIPSDNLVTDIKEIFKSNTWNPNSLLELMDRYEASPEMFLQRLTSVLPKFFNIKSLFFIRFNKHLENGSLQLSKELHLSGQHNPHATYLAENYCRRWVSTRILDELEIVQKENKYQGPLLDAQISSYIDKKNKYLVLSLARPMLPTPKVNCSVSIGLLLDDNLKQKINFLDDPKLKRMEVNETCERCNLSNCAERAAEPSIYNRLKHQASLEEALTKVIQAEGL